MNPDGDGDGFGDGVGDGDGDDEAGSDDGTSSDELEFEGVATGVCCDPVVLTAFAFSSAGFSAIDAEGGPFSSSDEEGGYTAATGVGASVLAVVGGSGELLRRADDEGDDGADDDTGDLIAIADEVDSADVVDMDRPCVYWDGGEDGTECDRVLVACSCWWYIAALRSCSRSFRALRRASFSASASRSSSTVSASFIRSVATILLACTKHQHAIWQTIEATNVPPRTTPATTAPALLPVRPWLPTPPYALSSPSPTLPSTSQIPSPCPESTTATMPMSDARRSQS